MIGDNVTHSRSGDFGELETLLKNEFGRVQGVFVSLCSEIAFQPLIDIYNHKPKERSTDQTTEMKIQMTLTIAHFNGQRFPIAIAPIWKYIINKIYIIVLSTGGILLRARVL